MLTNAAVKAAQPRDRAYKLHDAGGLHLVVRPSGSKTFRMKFRRGGKEQLLTFGSWPEFGLTDARARRDQVREQLDRGVDIKVNAAAVQICTFEQLARQWHEHRKSRWSPEHAADVLASLERDVFPAIGASSPRSIDARAVLDLLEKVEARGCIETARRLRERISNVFRFGIPREICSADPAALISDELSPRPVQRRQAALVDLTELVKFLQDVARLGGDEVVQIAHCLLWLTAVRLGTLRGARWSEFEGVNFSHSIPEPTPELIPQWRIPPARMKLSKVKKADRSAEHVIPLSRQAVAALRYLHRLTGHQDLLFPGRRRGRPIGEGAIGALYAAAGYSGRHVPHGWRASFSTVLNGRFPEDRGLIDQALAHVAHKGRVEAAYNRSTHEERMRDLFQRWADLLAPDGSSETLP